MSTSEYAIKIVSGTNDLSVRWEQVVNLVETWTRDYQVNKYADGHNSIYLLSAWRKTWKVIIYASDTARTFITALQSDTGVMALHPLYRYNQSTYYGVRVDNRAPLNYYGGDGDGETMLQAIFYEAGTNTFWTDDEGEYVTTDEGYLVEVVD